MSSTDYAQGVGEETATLPEGWRASSRGME
jgi:hypothetical protein